MIKNISLAGGGFYGIAMVGALKELEKYQDQIKIEKIVGVSVGSIIASLFAIGYTPDELNDILLKMNMDELIKDSSFSYYKLFEKFGMYDASALEDEIEKLIRYKTHIKLCTFCQIEKDLTIIATNLNYQRPRFFNKDNTPNFPISKAIRMSIGYPPVITPVLFEGDLYGDGGESINYPITYFKNLDETMGITFAAHNENNNGTLNTRVPINNFTEYIIAVGSTLSRATYTSQITNEHLQRSIVIKINEKINSMQFNLSDEQKKSIYQSGVDAVKEQISKILSV